MFLKSCFDCWVEIVEGKGKGWKPETNKEGIVVILVKKNNSNLCHSGNM